MLDPDYRTRISAADALKHPWFSIKKNETTKCFAGVIESLRKYSGYSKLKKKALNMLVWNLSEVDLKNLREKFLELDQQKTGLIMCDDLKECLKKCGCDMPAEELENLTRKVNYKGDAFINYTSFLSATAATQQFFTEEKLWSYFKILDVEKKGHITEKGLKAFLSQRQRLQSLDVAEIMRATDADHDGKITFNDFRDIFVEQKNAG